MVVEVLYSGIAMIVDVYVAPIPLLELTTSVERAGGKNVTVEQITLADARAEVEEDLKYTEKPSG